MGKSVENILIELKKPSEKDPNLYINLLLELAEQVRELSPRIDEILLIIADWNIVESADAKEVIKNEIDEKIGELTESNTLNLPRFIIKDREKKELPKIERNDILTCKNIEKKYPKSDFVLSGVNLTLTTGEITGVVGQNAHGKTTLLRILAGDLEPTFGDLDYSGLVGNRDKHRTHVYKSFISYVPQHIEPWNGDLLQNLTYEAAVHGLKGKANSLAVNRIVQRFWLQDFLKLSWKQLSGGYKLRFALARALVWRPKLLILDEPLAHLDVKAQEVILTDLRHLASSISNPLSIVASSQHLYEIEKISDRILFLKEGDVPFYSKVPNLAKDRKENVIELAVQANMETLTRVLSNFSYNSISQKGLDFVISLPLETSSDDLIAKLIKEKIRITSFRDISSSTKKLFM